MAGSRETEGLKPIDKAIFGIVSESPGRNASEHIGGLEKSEFRRSSLLREGKKLRILSIPTIRDRRGPGCAQAPPGVDL